MLDSDSFTNCEETWGCGMAGLRHQEMENRSARQFPNVWEDNQEMKTREWQQSKIFRKWKIQVRGAKCLNILSHFFKKEFKKWLYQKVISHRLVGALTTIEIVLSLSFANFINCAWYQNIMIEQLVGNTTIPLHSFIYSMILAFKIQHYFPLHIDNNVNSKCSWNAQSL